MTDQQGDVLLYQTADGGEINVENGVTEMTAGLEVAAYLSLFGGNEDDDGSADNPREWWGDAIEPDTAGHLRGETGYLLNRLTAAPYNISRLERAAVRDLAWFTSSGLATAVSVSVSIPEAYAARFDIKIEADGDTVAVDFTENWGPAT